MHKSRCPICKSDHLNEIDEQILEFYPMEEIASAYDNEFSIHTIKNHAKNTGVYDKMMKNKRKVLQKIIIHGLERMGGSKFKMDVGHIIKATELHARLDGDLVDKVDHTHRLADDDLVEEAEKMAEEARKRKEDAE